MPKIEIDAQAFYKRLGKTPDNSTLELMLESAKAELDDWDQDKGILKIELNDTNRPDLWSTAGLARQLRLAAGETGGSYDFFSNRESSKVSGDRLVEVDPKLAELRPYIAAFCATGPPISDPVLKDLIQTQEKLCWNYGRKRKSIAMGMYRSDLIEYPVQYRAASPDTSFVPLGEAKSMTLDEIVADHPKGKDFGWIVADLPLKPFLTDGRGEVLSFPPIINSAKIGAVEVGDQNLFIELTGTDLPSLLVAASIVACDMADAGFSIEPATIRYPYDTPLGREITTPFYFQTPVDVDAGEVTRLLGVEVSPEESEEVVRRMGSCVERDGSTLRVYPAEYRNDFLHPVDVVEDVMIGRGMSTFTPEMPRDFTVGRLTPIEEFSREAKSIMVGLGFQEMIFPYLGSYRDFVERMMSDPNRPQTPVRVANPISENYEYVRDSTLPSLLSAEAAGGNAVYPHHIFEVGKYLEYDSSRNYGTRTVHGLGFLSADRAADFNLVNSHVSALFYYISRDYRLEAYDDPRFIPGRCAAIFAAVDGEDVQVGVFGEVHPQVLENFGIGMPCSACEVDLGRLSGWDSGSG